MKKTRFFAWSLLALMVFATACDKNPVTPNEEELITTLKYTLTPAGGGTAIILTYKDIDGDGAGAPIVTQSGSLAANTTYNGVLELLNEAETPAINITTEILAEKEAHQFFFQAGSALTATITYQDKDANNKPLGIETSLTTAAASEGGLRITLRHEPNKTASGVSDGDITNAGGETDIEAYFGNVKIQ